MEKKDFYWGFSHCGYFDTLYPWAPLSTEEKIKRAVREMREIGVGWWRPHIHWHIVEPVIKNVNLKVSDVTEEMVENYAFVDKEINWKDCDLMVDICTSQGIGLFIVLCCGYTWQLPLFRSEKGYIKATPNNVGRENYLGLIYLHTRAAVRRYKDRVKVWELENELNGAAETILAARWRHGSLWFSFNFLTDIIKTMYEAVKKEDPEAKTTHNFHTDARILHPIYSWKIDVKKWIKYLDIIGIDPYPNYIMGRPVGGKIVCKKAKAAKKISQGKPVMILESGYPVKPGWRMYSEKGQTRYIQQIADLARRNDADGFFYYCLVSPEGYPTEGPWSYKYFQAIEHWWGMIRSDDSYRPAFYEYREIIQKNK